MTTEETLYGISCDNCRDSYTDEHSGFSYWADHGNAEEAAANDNWYTGHLDGEHEGKHYCPKCFKYDEDVDDVIHVDKTRFKPSDESPSSSTPSLMSPTSMSDSAEKDSTIIQGVVIKHEPAPETYGGVAVHTAIGNFAVARLHQKEAREKIGHKVFVRSLPDFYKTVEIISWDAEPGSAEELNIDARKAVKERMKVYEGKRFSEMQMTGFGFDMYLAGHNRADGKAKAFAEWIRNNYFLSDSCQWCEYTHSGRENAEEITHTTAELYAIFDKDYQPSPDAEVLVNKIQQILDMGDADEDYQLQAIQQALETYKQQKQ